MRTKWVLVVFIAVTAVVFAFIQTAVQVYWLAALAVGLGIGWLLLEIRDKPPVATVFFVAFLALALIGSFNQAPTLAILFGLSTDLAAWDLSRFRARIAGETDDQAVLLVEVVHLRKLALTAGAGFFLAVLPLFMQISIPFVVLLLLILVLLIVLRQSALALRDEREN